MATKVGVSGFSNDEFTALGYLLYPYDVELTLEAHDADLVIGRGRSPNSAKPLIRMTNHHDWQGDYQEPISDENGVVELSFDLISTCLRIFQGVMNPRLAATYKLSTRMPFRYNLAPSWVRSCLLKMHRIDSNLSRHIANEVSRKILVRAFDLLGFWLRRRNPPSLVISHDIESEKGLQRALSFKSVENDLGIKSTWFLPSDQYPVSKSIARDLADGSTIGSHDVKHDGRLIYIREREKVIQRLKESRLKLEGIFEKKVEAFRSPLLQSGHKIVNALAEAGYRFDFSLPCWEPIHPLTMGGFGVESLQPFRIDGVTEIPLTLFQDHQVFNVMGMSTHEAIRFWVDQAKLIRNFEGDMVLLVHPEYSFSRDLQGYRELLRSLMEVQRCTTATAPLQYQL